MKHPSLGAEVAPLAACMVFAAALSVHAQLEDGARRGSVEQKAALVQRILRDSPAARRIRTSGNAQAQQFLSAADEKYRLALGLLGDGRVEAGETAINDAMRLIAKAREIVPDSVQRADDQRLRYARSLGSTQSLLASALAHAGRAGVRHDADDIRRQIARAAELLEEARTLAGKERFDDANRMLQSAEQALLDGLNRAIGSATLDYTPRFETPADEFRFEIERFRSAQGLVPVALAQLQPSREAAGLAERYLEKSVGLRDAALVAAERREYPVALATIREATDWLQRALSATGLVTPQQ